MQPEFNMTDTRKTQVVVATTVLLSFISFWRAAAIVLNDLASSAYYVGGIAEEAIGKSAPWFILGVMLFSYAVRAVYVESCGMFTRGGVFTDELIDSYIGLKMEEVLRWEMAPSPVEFDMYYSA